jgi:hypothetical protein
MIEQVPTNIIHGKYSKHTKITRDPIKEEK